MGPITIALGQTGLGTGIRYSDVHALNLYWGQVRMLYSLQLLRGQRAGVGL